MLKKTIKYKDLDGNPAEEDAYFNLTKAEAIELNIRNDLEVIGRSKNQNEIMDTFKRILQMSYGVRTGDGKFLKEERDFKTFIASEAYSELFMEIWQNPDYALEFIRGILPAEVVAEMPGQPTQGNQSSIPAHLANHPSMQGHKEQAPPTPQPQPAPSEPQLRAQAYPEQRPTESPQEMEARLRREIEEQYANQNKANTPPESGVTTPEAPQQVVTPPRDELI